MLRERGLLAVGWSAYLLVGQVAYVRERMALMPEHAVTMYHPPRPVRLTQGLEPLARVFEGIGGFDPLHEVAKEAAPGDGEVRVVQHRDLERGRYL